MKNRLSDARLHVLDRPRRDEHGHRRGAGDDQPPPRAAAARRRLRHARAPAPCCRSSRTRPPTASRVNDTLKPVSRFWDRIERPEQLTPALLAAMRVLTDPAETGAVTLALPQDVQAEALRLAGGAVRQARLARSGARVPEPDVLARAPPSSSAPRARPLIVAGGGTIYAEATDALRELAEATGIGVGETQAGKGSLPYDHPQALGAIGATGTTAANAARPRGRRDPRRRHPLERLHDRVAAASSARTPASSTSTSPRSTPSSTPGCRSSPTPGSGSRRSTRRSDVSFDTPANDWDATVERAYTTPAPAARAGRGDRRRQPRLSGPRDVVVCAAGIDARRPAQAVAHARPEGLPRRVRLLDDGLRDRRRARRSSWPRPTARSSCMVGDGSYLMMAQELVTAVAEGIKLTIVLVQNHGYQSIGALSESVGSQRFGTKYRYRGTDEILPVDLAANAASLGADVHARHHDRGLRGGAARGGRRRRARRSCRSHRPDDRRARLRGLVGRPGGRGRRARVHPGRARAVRAATSAPRSST